MAVLDHLIVKVNELEASVAFYVEIMGFGDVSYEGPFGLVHIAADQQLQLAPWGTEGNEHFAFAVTAVEFEAIFERVKSAGIDYGPSFHDVGINQGPGVEAGARGDAPTLFFRSKSSLNRNSQLRSIAIRRVAYWSAEYKLAGGKTAP